MMGLNESAGVALVVDDEHFARLFALQVLVDQRFVVLEAVSATEAIEVLHENPDVSLVFSDIGMPGEMDGIGLAHHVRDACPELALILTSGHEAPPEASSIANMKFLAKPYTALALIEAVSSVTGNEPAAGPPPYSMVMLGQR
jgi:two-component system, response regulator PdtaR